MQWLLTQAGADGQQLTQDGYLKPAVVGRAVRELGWAYRRPGAANRENQTLPVLMLRQQLQTWKLLRKSPPWDQRQRIIADTLNGAGFLVDDGKPVPLDVARDLYSDVRWTLDCLQLKVPERTFSDVAALTDGGRKFLMNVQGLLEGM